MKQLNDFAIFGHAPIFSEPLHVGRPNIGDRDVLVQRLSDLLDRKWLTNNGPYVQELEQRLADFLGVRHCIAICNATVALEIAIRALGLTGEVIVPSFTFVATAHALQWLGVTPVFGDIDPTTHNIDPSVIEPLITSRTTGILGVHVWGRACDIEGLSSIAHRHNLKLLFDAAHAFGCSYGGRMIGGFGDAEVFSFHATKFFNTFEGGAIATNNDELAAKMRLMRNFGFADFDRVVSVGINGKMNEIAAAMGLTGLESLDEFISVNEQNYMCYQSELAEIPGIYLLAPDVGEKTNYQYIVLEVDQLVTQISRDNLLGILRAENVLARRYFYPGCHRMEPYATLFPQASHQLPETERLTQRVLILPTGTAVDAEIIRQICEIIRLAVNHGREITTRLSSKTLVSEISG